MYVVHAPGIAPALLQEILRMELKLLGPWELDLWPIPQGRGHRGVGRRVGRWRWSWRWRGGGRFWHRIHLISWNMIRNRTFLPRARYIHTYIHTYIQMTNRSWHPLIVCFFSPRSHALIVALSFTAVYCTAWAEPDAGGGGGGGPCSFL